MGTSPGEPRPPKNSLVLSNYYVALAFGAVRWNGRRRQVAHPLLQGNEADAPQMRGKIRHRPPHQQHLAVQRGDEARHRQVFARGDLLEDFPEHLFEPDAGALPVKTDGTRLIDVAVWVLAGKQMAHAFLPFPLFLFAPVWELFRRGARRIARRLV